MFPVDVDTNKVVDGSTEEDDDHAGDEVTHVGSKLPEAEAESVEWSQYSNKKVSHCQGYHDQVESLLIKIYVLNSIYYIFTNLLPKLRRFREHIDQ